MIVNINMGEKEEKLNVKFMAAEFKGGERLYAMGEIVSDSPSKLTMYQDTNEFDHETRDLLLELVPAVIRGFYDKYEELKEDPSKIIGIAEEY